MLMSTLPPTLERTAEETGAVLVLFAVLASVGTLMFALVLDVGNWFEHQRHLQLEADAAAHAAARAVSYPCTVKDKREVYEKAALYGGVNSVITPEGEAKFAATPYNQQVGGEHAGEVHEEVNKRAYFGQPLKEKPSRAEELEEKAPCDPKSTMVDVKMTESELPWFFNVAGKAFNVVPNINAHARVSIVQQRFATAVEPIIESQPIEARVFYVNDERCLSGGKYEKCADGTKSNYEQEQLATGRLEIPSEEPTNEERGTVIWTDRCTKAECAAKPVALKITAPHIGVRIAVAGKEGALKGPKEGGATGNDTVAVCKHEYVECFDEDVGVVPPLMSISGYSLTSKGKSEPLAPVSHKVTLSTPSPDTCTDPYFSVGNETTPMCTLTISAQVDYGSASTTGITVIPQFVYTPGFSGETKTENGLPLKFEGGVWTGIGTVPSLYEKNYGSSEINLVVKCKREAKAPCEKSSKAEESFTLKDVQRVFSAGPDGSNRIATAKVFEPEAEETPVPRQTGADAYRLCQDGEQNPCEHKLAVTVELKGSLENATKYFGKDGKTPIAPFHILYADNDQDSDDQFVVSCPPTTNSTGIVEAFRESLHYGCKGKYGVNTQVGESCAADKAAQEASEKEAAARTAREKTEKEERAKWEAEEKSKTITKAQREAKEATQKTAREAKEAEEAAAKAKREGAIHECVGLVSVQKDGKHPGDELTEAELSANFQNYFNFRIQGAPNGLHYYCPNKWVNNNEGAVPAIPGNDSRLIQLFVVPFTVTDFQRKNEVPPLVPIRTFATFYVTGYEGDTCKTDDKVDQAREIAGHLIKYINSVGEEPGGVACKAEELGTCEAVLTE
jgi:hypothetical protein